MTSQHLQFPLANEAFTIGAWLFPELGPYAGTINYESATFANRAVLDITSMFFSERASSIDDSR